MIKWQGWWWWWWWMMMMGVIKGLNRGVKASGKKGLGQGYLSSNAKSGSRVTDQVCGDRIKLNTELDTLASRFPWKRQNNKVSDSSQWYFVLVAYECKSIYCQKKLQIINQKNKFKVQNPLFQSICHIVKHTISDALLKIHVLETNLYCSLTFPFQCMGTLAWHQSNSQTFYFCSFCSAVFIVWLHLPFGLYM